MPEPKNITEALARRVEELPTLPTVATQLLSKLGDDEQSMHDVAKLVQTDAALTARVLRVANSAAFSRGKPITSLFRAIMHLGMRMVVGITVGASANLLVNRSLKGYGTDEETLWDHSLRSAIGAREFSFYCKKNVAEDLAYTAGLLHDIGKVVISEFIKDSGEKLGSTDGKGRLEDYTEAEREKLGTDHAAVGMAIAKRWSLPQPIIEAVAYHHTPSQASPENLGLLYCVHLGDLIALTGGAGEDADALHYQVDENFENFISINENQLTKLISNVQTEFEQTRNAIYSSH